MIKHMNYQEFINKLTGSKASSKLYFVLVIPYKQRSKVVATHQCYGVN